MPVAVQTDLVFDVGMHDGGDTAFYLNQGYRVIAIEADPSLVAEVNKRFSPEIESGRLTILNVGITASASASVFWISSKNRVWSSFNQCIAARKDYPHRPIRVPTCRFADILIQYGVPYYLKVDIEGNDTLCIEDLAGLPLPLFVSMETECLTESEFLTEDGSRATLDALYKVGYRRFKLIYQRDFSAVDFDMPENKCGLEHGYRFRMGDSGPWGDQTPGRWFTYQEATRQLAFAAKLQVESWHDWHAAY